MLAVLSITAPIFIIIGLGFLSARIGLVNREQARGMGTLAATVAAAAAPPALRLTTGRDPQRPRLPCLGPTPRLGIGRVELVEQQDGGRVHPSRR